jgi:hypothetical protein
MMADNWQDGKSHSMEPLADKIVLSDILLDRQSREPLYHQIARQIARATREGNRDQQASSTSSLYLRVL